VSLERGHEAYTFGLCFVQCSGFVLVRPNDIESLSPALITLLEDAGKRNRLENAAQPLVEKQFSTQRIVRRLFVHLSV